MILGTNGMKDDEEPVSIMKSGVRGSPSQAFQSHITLFFELLIGCSRLPSIQADVDLVHTHTI